ncbi:rhodanese-like domain-containing protein [Jonesia quinghaiensis]|uniref:rhodanese-like domain-containing protein n=1 Tax=Jonesia quinghaiensis TaxID=262806 RepID=UPI000420BBC3|nr:rhodanese-like domain-containing protein [Jonesia quinghaiensis]
MTYAGDLTPQQAYDLVKDNPDAIFVDVRTVGEWQQIGVPDLTSINKDVHFIEWVTAFGPNTQFLSQLAETGVKPGDNRPIVFICRAGNRSIGAATIATEEGYGPAYNVLEGFEGDTDEYGQRTVNGWKLRGLPSTSFTSGE